MPTFTVEYATEAERLELERAVAYLAEMRRVGASAAHGTVLNTCELLALDKGRQLLRDNLAATLQTRADAEKKVPAASAKDAGPAT